MGRIQEYSMINCAVNPQTGRERVTAYNPVLRPKRVLVAGGGPAGMEAARVLAERGHRPELFERTGCLGGNLLAAGAPPFKEDELALARWYENELRRLEVPIHLNTTVDTELAASGFDAVVIATGSTAKTFSLGEGAPVCTAAHILTGQAPCGNRAVVVGGGLVGCETALWLAQSGKTVTIVEALDRLMAVNRPLCHANSEMLDRLIPFHGIQVLTGASVKSWSGGSLRVEAAGGPRELPCDTIILAVGFREEDSLYRALEGRVPELYLLGDARKVSNIMYAIWDAFEIANHI